jgi:hypothetical protein
MLWIGPAAADAAGQRLFASSSVSFGFLSRRFLEETTSLMLGSSGTLNAAPVAKVAFPAVKLFTGRLPPPKAASIMRGIVTL